MTLYPNPGADAELSRFDTETLRRLVVEGGKDQFAQGLIEALKPRTHCIVCGNRAGYVRWAFNLFAKIAKLTNSETLVIQAFVAKFGATDENDLLRLAGEGRKMRALADSSNLNFERVRDECVSLLRVCLRDHPEWRADILHALGGTRLELTRHAPVNGNGDHDA